MKDMALTPAEVQEKKEEYSTDPEIEKYPWGLEIRLGNEELEKLGISNLPAVGTKMSMSAVVRVDSARSEQTDKELRRNIELQITHMELKPHADKDDSIEVLYGDEGS